MERTPLLLGQPSPPARRPRIALLLVLVGISFLFIFSLIETFGTLVDWYPRERYEVSPLDSQGDVGSWSWKDVRAGKELKWERCYEIYDCAALDVPLDWVEPSEELRASIAVIRFNATRRGDEYKGAVFINPGGPGGSGVWFVKHLAPYYQLVVGKNYDIISFDPRGVGYSTPHISCFNTPQSALLWDLLSLPVLDAHPGILNDAYARASAFSQQCSSTFAPTNSPPLPSYSDNFTSPLSYVSTASTARDMLAILHATGSTKLKYWGFSYGTYLGATFASLYPSSVDLMVNDGVVDAVQYSDSRGVGFIHDTEAVLDSFFHFCHLAGPSNCSFWSSSASEIKTRMSNVLEDLRDNPIVVPANADRPRPEIVTYSSLKRLITSSLYRPMITFPSLATVLSALERRDGEPYLALNPPLSQDPFGCSPNDASRSLDQEELEGTADAANAIMCSDNAGVHEPVEDFQNYIDELVGISPSAGAVMGEMRLGCVGWGARAKWRFDGPFTGTTSTPILFISNTADNVTPLRSARANQKGFPGSVILIQDSYGHTSLSTPSLCTVKTIQRYFQHGRLPKDGTVCKADLVPFDPWDVEDPTSLVVVGTGYEEEVEEDRELKVAMRELMRVPVPVPGFR